MGGPDITGYIPPASRGLIGARDRIQHRPDWAAWLDLDLKVKLADSDPD